MFNSILQEIQELVKVDNSKLVIYLGISIFIYYFLEKIKIEKLFLIIIIVVCVILFYKNKNIKLTSSNNLEKTNNIKNKIQHLKQSNPNLKENVNIDKLNEDINKIERFIKINIKKQIPTSSSFLNKVTNPKIQTHYLDLLDLLDLYLKEIEGILEIKEYKNKNYEKLLDIKKEININIHSLFFQLDINYDIKIATLINNINSSFKDIESFLKEFINKDFKENPHCLGGFVNDEENAPRCYDNTQDKDCHIVQF